MTCGFQANLEMYWHEVKMFYRQVLRFLRIASYLFPIDRFPAWFPRLIRHDFHAYAMGYRQRNGAI